MTGIPISIRRVREREREGAIGTVIPLWAGACYSLVASLPWEGEGKRSDSISLQLSNHPTRVDLSINKRLSCERCHCTIWKAFRMGVQRTALAPSFIEIVLSGGNEPLLPQWSIPKAHQSPTETLRSHAEEDSVDKGHGWYWGGELAIFWAAIILLP